MKIRAVCATTAVLAGCASPHPDMTRDEWLATSTREYKGVTKDQAINAAEKLFRLAAGKEFNIAHTEDGLMAVRNWSAFLLIIAASGSHYWTVKSTPTSDGVKVSMHVSMQSQGMAPIAVGGGIFVPMSTPQTGAPVKGTAIYDVFWARMDYLLGKSPNWMTCAVADDRVKKGITFGTNEPLCHSIINTLDTDPSIQTQ